MNSAVRATAVGLLLLASGAGQAAGQAAIDSSLFAYIRGLKAIDNHAHPVSTDPGDRDFDALPIDGFPPFAFPLRLSPDNPELVDAWRDLYGYRYADRSPAHLAELKAEKIRIKAEQGDNYPAWVLDRLGIGVQLANRMALGRGVEPPRFRWVAFVDPLIFPVSTKGLETTPDRADLFPRTERNLRRYLGDVKVGALPATFQGYLARVVTPTLERMARGGAVAVKYEAAYLRKLDFGPATLAEARSVYDRYRAGGAPSPTVWASASKTLSPAAAPSAPCSPPLRPRSTRPCRPPAPRRRSPTSPTSADTQGPARGLRRKP